MNDLVQYEKQFDAIAGSVNPYPVDFDLAWQWAGYSAKHKGLNMLTANFQEGLDFSTERLKSTGGRPADGYFLSVDCFKAFCMMAGTQRGKEVRQYYLTVEKKYLELRQYGKALADRLDRIEGLLGTLVSGQSRPENNQDKESRLYDFINQNITITRIDTPVKRVEVWERYTKTVGKAAQMTQNEFFERLKAVFPEMGIEKTRIGPYCQLFCFGIGLK